MLLLSFKVRLYPLLLVRNQDNSEWGVGISREEGPARETKQEWPKRLVENLEC